MSEFGRDDHNKYAGTGVASGVMRFVTPSSQGRGLAFRQMREDDLPFLAALYGSTRTDEMAQVPWSDEQRAQFLQMQFDAQHRHYQQHYPDADFLVMEHDGAAVGRLYLEEWDSEFRIIDIALMPACRGQGFGAAVLDDVMREAERRQKAVRIHVEKNNPAMSLYLRLGFATLEDKGVYDLMEWRACDKPAQVKTAS